ncbi:fructosamine kinase family protein [Galbibacter sp. EGI 63066]|uniref:fructosamine kinase family protein n=1 Tax=Galbibacter sp. EGI 63066 TaxID=2993559 RepID=UPI0022499694|nr:fructosamine kinase family protein [Galbibacter sp. EGI 63066]MCX2681657.1 fructosamine kinase family protein [Galbibacter sp. EGI 63066]
MIDQSLKEHLKGVLNTNQIYFNPLSGGDINDVYRITTDSQSLIIKLNNARKFPGMFEAEAMGLTTLSVADCIRIPKVKHCSTLNSTSFLIMEDIPKGEKSVDFWTNFGKELAGLHQKTQDFFGFESDNYIGSLPQQNNLHKSGIDFYILERLEPQLKRAHNNGYSFKNTDLFFKNLESIIPIEPPALIHGDLWNGNFLIDNNGASCLIDPAVCYASREMDIAMMHLFGGFDRELFDQYNSIFPLAENWKNRLDVWQLYYLLVHLNLFGGGYLRSVESILKKYT